jgi:hypothetical protein
VHAEGKQQRLPHQVALDLQAYQHELAMYIHPAERGQRALKISAAHLLSNLPLPASALQHFGSPLKALARVRGVHITYPEGGSSQAMVSMDGNTHRRLWRWPPETGQQQQQQQQQQQRVHLPQLTARQERDVHQWLCRVATVMRVAFPPKQIRIETLEVRAPPPRCIYEVFGGVSRFTAEVPELRDCGGFISLDPVFHQWLLDQGMGREAGAHAGRKRARQR